MVVIFGLLLVSGLPVACSAEDVKSPLEPEQALKQFQLDPGLTIELVASEPEVIDPVAIRFDEDGRLWGRRNARLSAWTARGAAAAVDDSPAGGS